MSTMTMMTKDAKWWQYVTWLSESGKWKKYM